MELLTSPLLAARHGFPTREGGVSEGPFRALNCSRVVGDRPEAVEENLRRLAEAAGGPVVAVSQVHGVVVAQGETAAPTTEADALTASTPGLVVGVRTADCVPVLVEDREGPRVAAVHAGWRGVVGGVLERAVDALLAQGARLEGLRFAIGPCIQACCFEVDGDLPARFSDAFGPGVVVPPGGGSAKARLDLPGALRLALERRGVQPAHIDLVRACTSCDPRFFSHRRDRGVTGRHLSFITCPQGATGV